MPRSRALITLTSLVMLAAGALAGCHSDEPVTLPDGPTLVSSSANAMRNVSSAHVTINTAGQIGSVPLRTAEGDLTRTGNAKGSIKMITLGVLLQLDFVVVGKDYYIKGLSGGWQKQSAADVSTFYDPSAILSPDQGVAKILMTATNAKTEAADTVDGVDTFRVAVTLDSLAVATVVPGVPGGITGQLWLERTSFRLVKAVLQIPNKGSAPGTVTIGLTNLDKPVTVSAP